MTVTKYEAMRYEASRIQGQELIDSLHAMADRAMICDDSDPQLVTVSRSAYTRVWLARLNNCLSQDDLTDAAYRLHPIGDDYASDLVDLYLVPFMTAVAAAAAAPKG